jgi:general secretion pathway protein G
MEMLLVLGIIALLSGLGTVTMTDVFEDGNEVKARGDIQALKASIIRYKTKAGVYPSTAQGLDALVTRPTTPPLPRSWKPYLTSKDALLDPWLQPYKYEIPARRSSDSYDIYSLGKDGQEGTDDDIGNW